MTVAELLTLQCGVISRRQVLAARRRTITTSLDSSVVGCGRGSTTACTSTTPAKPAGSSALGRLFSTTGRPPWTEGPRSWRMVFARPDSGRARGSQVAIDRARSVAKGAGISVTRRTDLDRQAQYEPVPAPGSCGARAADRGVEDRRTRRAAVAVLADACQRRHTTPGRLADAARRRPVLRSPTAAALDPGRRVERRLLRPGAPVSPARRASHGLPTGSRQRRVRVGRRVHYRDVEYLGLATTVELDGRIGHETTSDRWADLDRDVDAAVRGDVTLRIGWKQVLDPCRLAAAVARVLIARGWAGRPRPCRKGCAARRGQCRSSFARCAEDLHV